jgi:hypothetical protein
VVLEAGRSQPARRSRRLLAGGDGTGRGVAGHAALMADPVDRRGRALGLGLVRGGEEGGVAGEAELEEVEAVAEPDQVGAELIWGDLGRRSSQEGVDRAHEAVEEPSALLSPSHITVV